MCVCNLIFVGPQSVDLVRTPLFPFRICPFIDLLFYVIQVLKYLSPVSKSKALYALYNTYSQYRSVHFTSNFGSMIMLSPDSLNMVKAVYKGHPRDQKKVDVMRRWHFSRGLFGWEL